MSDWPMCSGHFCPFQMVFLAGQLGLCQYPLTATGIEPNFIHHESKRQSVLYCSNFPIQIHIPLRTICLFACLQALCLCFRILKGSVFFFFWSCVVLNRLFLLWIEAVIYFLGVAWTQYCLPRILESWKFLNVKNSDASCPQGQLPFSFQTDLDTWPVVCPLEGSPTGWWSAIAELSPSQAAWPSQC